MVRARARRGSPPHLRPRQAQGLRPGAVQVRMVLPLPFDDFFPKLPLSKGDREMTLRRADRGDQRPGWPRARAAKETARFEVEWHKKFAISAACLVFGLLGLGLSLGSRKEARSAAFALSIAVIFVYYVLIRLGEQAGDTGLMPPFLVDVGGQPRAGGGRPRAPGLEPPRGGLRPSRPPPLPRPPAPAAPREAGAGREAPHAARPRRWCFASRGSRCASPPSSTATSRGATWAYVILVLAAFGSIFLLAALHGPLRRHPAEPRPAAGWSSTTTLYLQLWPSLHLVAPVAVLVAVLVTFGILTRRNEITAMKAGGLSVYRIAAPLMVMGLLASATLFAMQEFVLPSTNRIADQDFNVIKGRPPQSSSLLDRRWILASDGRFYNYDYLVARKNPAEAGVAEGPARATSSPSTACPSTTSTPRPGSCASGSTPGAASWNAPATATISIAAGAAPSCPAVVPAFEQTGFGPSGASRAASSSRRATSSRSSSRPTP